MNETAIQKIQQALEENLFEPNKGWSDYIFEERSYARWAAYEIMNRIMDRPYDDPEIIVEEFALMIAKLGSETRVSTKRRIFLIAYQTAADILTIL